MPRPKSPHVKIRLNLEVTADIRDRINRLQEEMEAESMSEVIRRSLAVYEKLLSMAGKAGCIVVRQRDGTEVLLLLAPDAKAE